MPKRIQFYDDLGKSVADPLRVKVNENAITGAGDIDLTATGVGGYVEYAGASAGTVNIVQIPDASGHLKDGLITQVGTAGNTNTGYFAATTNLVGGYASTATAAATTTLVVGSAGTQTFTGATTQICKLPVVTTLPQAGLTYRIINQSSGAVTVNSSGSNAVQVVAAGASAFVTNNKISADTTAAAWDVVYILTGVGGSTGATDNRLLRADGTGGSTVQGSAIGCDDSGNLTGINSLNVLLASYLATTVTYNNTAALADTALSVTLEAATKYAIQLVVHSTSAVKALLMDFGGTATMTGFVGQWLLVNAGTGGPSAGERSTAAGTDFDCSLEDGSDVMVMFTGSCLTNAAGTFLLRGAQNAANASNTTILAGSTLILTKIG